MNKNKKNITIILGILVLLVVVIGFSLYGGFGNSKGSTYTVTVGECENGMVKSDKLIYKEGDLVTLTIMPKGSYELETILIDGSDKTSDVTDGQLQVKIKADMDVRATFREVVTRDTLVTIPDTCNMRGMELTLVEEGKEPVKVTVSDDNTFNLLAVRYGTNYEVTGTVCGVPAFLGNLIVKSECEEFDPSWLYNVSYDGTLDLAGGNFTYENISTQKLAVVAKEGSIKKGDAWIAAKINLSPEDVVTLTQTEGAEASFGIGMTVGDRTEYVDIWMKNWEITTPPETVFGLKSKLKQQNSIFLGAGLLTDYGKALAGDGVYYVLHYNAEDGTLESYLGETMDTVTKVCDWGTSKQNNSAYFKPDSALYEFTIGSNRAWGSTPVTVNFSDVKYGATLGEALGILEKTGSINAELVGIKHGVSSTKVSDGTIVTLTRDNFETVHTTVKNGKLVVKSIPYGSWTVNVDGYETTTITVGLDKKYSDKITIQHILFVDYLKEAGWNDYVDLTRQNKGIVTQESGQTMFIATNDTYDSVAISLNLSVEGLTEGRHGTFVKFGNEYVFIQLEPVNKGENYKISWNGFGGAAKWPPDQNNVNLKPEYWKEQVKALSAEQIAGLNDGSLYFTLLRKDNTIYAFVDGEYCNKVVLDDKYTDMKCQVGIYGTKMKKNMVRNFKIESGESYLAAHPNTGALDVNVTGHEYKGSGNTLTDGEKLTLTLKEYGEEKTLELKGGKISLNSLEAGKWLISAEGYVPHEIIIPAGGTFSGDIVLEKALFTDYLDEANWNKCSADLTKQNYGVIAQESGSDLFIGSTASYDSVAISLNLSTEGLTKGRHGVFVQFDNEYVFIGLEPQNDGESYKICWNGFGGVAKWPPEYENNKNLKPEYWKEQVKSLSEEQIAGLNDGSLYFTLVRKDNVICAFVDGQYCNEIVLDEKYADKECQVGIYGQSMSEGMIRNFKIEDGADYFGTIDAKIEGYKDGTAGNTISDGEKVTLTSKVGGKKKTTVITDGKITVNGLEAGVWIIKVDKHIPYEVTIPVGATLSDDVILEYSLFTDYLGEADFNNCSTDLSKQKDGVITHQSGSEMFIGSNDTYDSVAISLNLSLEGLTSGRHGAFVKFGNDYVFIELEAKSGGGYKICWDSSGKVQQWPPNKSSHKNIGPTNWAEQVSNLSAEQIEKFNNGSLYFTLVREGNVIYAFVDGEYCNKVTLDAKYTDAKCQVGLYGINITTGSKVRNFKIEEASRYRNVIVRLEEQIEGGSIVTNADSIKVGDKLTVTLTPDQGYIPASLTINGEPVAGLEFVDNKNGTYSYTFECNIAQVTLNATFIEGREVSGTVTATAGASEPWNLPIGTTVQFSGATKVATTVEENGAYSLLLPTGNYTVSSEGYGTQTLDVTEEAQKADIQLVFDLIADTNDYAISSDESSAVVQKKWGTANFNQLHDQFVLYYTVKPVEGKTVQKDDNMGIYILEDQNRYGTQSWCNGTTLGGVLTYNGNTGKDDTIKNYGDKVPSMEEMNTNGHKYALVRNGSNFTIYIQNNSGSYEKAAEFTNKNFTGVQLMNWTTTLMFSDIAYTPGLCSELSGTVTAVAGASEPWKLPTGTTIEFTSATKNETVVVNENGTYSILLPEGSYTVSSEGYGTQTLNVTEATQKADIQLVFDLIADTNDYTISSDESSAVVQKKWGKANFNQLHDQFVLYYTVKPVEGKTVQKDDNMGIYILEGQNRYGTQSWCNGTTLGGVLTYNGNTGNDDIIKNYGDKVPSLEEMNTKGHKYALVRNGSNFTIYIQNNSGTYVKAAEFTNKNFTGVQLMNWTTTLEFSDIAYTYGEYNEVSGTVTATAGASEPWKVPTGTTIKFANAEKTETVTVGEDGTYSARLPIGSYTVSVEGYKTQTLDVTENRQKANIQLVFDLIADTNDYTISSDESSAVVKNKYGKANFNQLHDKFVLYYTVKPVEGKTVKRDDNMGIYILEGTNRYGTQSWCSGTALGGVLTYNGNTGSDDIIQNYGAKIPSMEEMNTNGHKYALVRNGSLFTIYIQNSSGTYVKAAEFTNENFTGVQLMNWVTHLMFTDIAYSPYSRSEVNGTVTATAGASEPWKLPTGTTIKFANAEITETVTVGENGKYNVQLPLGSYTVSVDGYTTQTLNVTENTQKANIQLVFDLIADTTDYTVSKDESSAVVQKVWGRANFNQLHDQFVLYYTVKPVEGKTVKRDDNMGIYILEGNNRYGTQSWCNGTTLGGVLTYNGAGNGDATISNYGDKIPSMEEMNTNGHQYALARNGSLFTLYIKNSSGVYVKATEFTNENFTGVQLMNWTTNLMFSDIAYTPDLGSFVPVMQQSSLLTLKSGRVLSSRFLENLF